MARKSEVRKYLSVIKRAISFIEAELDREDGTLEELLETMSPESTRIIPTAISQSQHLPVANIVKAIEEEVHVEVNPAREKHIQDLMAIDCWPEAVPQHLAVQPTDSQQKKRATSVLDMILNKSIEGLNVLDFGCGEGWMADEARKRGAANVVGYDPVKSDKWEQLSGCQFTPTYQNLESNFFDIVFLYDVLDHCSDAQQVMSIIKNVIKDNGVVYVRCHPWTARTATHLYKQGINKAYMHMFLTWDEIKSLTGTTPVFTRKEKNPIEAYRWWFKDFKIVKERVIREDVSDFFKHPDFKNLLANEQNILEINDFLKLMEIQFVDYELQLK